MKRIVLDIETEPFSGDFKDAPNIKEKIRYAPRMRVACVFDESRRKYSFYTEDEHAKLIKVVVAADEIVTFNGKMFDIPVLRRHCGLKGRVRHCDIHEIMSARAGFRVSLNRAVEVNFGERKHTDGRSMQGMSLPLLKAACRSDVSQTYQLFLRYCAGTLAVPQKTWTRKDGDAEHSYDPTPGECPKCHLTGSLQEIDLDDEEMTDGQSSDYVAGLWGIALCRSCGQEIEWGF